MEDKNNNGYNRYYNNKEQLQILILQAQENIKKQATNSKKEALDTLTDVYSTICFYKLH